MEGVDDVGDMNVDITILLVRNPFETHRSYSLFVERYMRGWGPRTFQEFIRLWEKTNLHWVNGPGAPEWVQTEDQSMIGRVLVLRYEHLLSDPMQALTPLVTAGVISSSQQLKDALYAASPAFHPSPRCHLADFLSTVGKVCEEGGQEDHRKTDQSNNGQSNTGHHNIEQSSGNEGVRVVRASRNALEGFTPEEATRTFKRKRQVLQKLGYSLVPPGQSCSSACRKAKAEGKEASLGEGKSESAV
jgi:hypothetical protein